MVLDQFAPRHKTFVFTEYLEEGNFEAHSCGNGRFIQGAPSADFDICFRLYKVQSFLNIRIHEVNLLHWLRAIPSLHDDLGDDEIQASISMDLLLPRYPEVSAKFDQDKRDGRSFDALNLFVHHFLREGSVFATFGLEQIHEKQILTELHFHDIQNQDRSMSEDLDLLDEAIGEVDEQDVKKPSQACLFMNEPLRSQLRAAIKGRDPIAVDKVLAMGLAIIDTKILCLALRYYERTVFDLLLNHTAQVGVDDIIAKLLYRAAKAGLMDAVQLLLTYDASKRGGDSCDSTTPLNGAASGGHLPIVQYLIEERGANINGNEHQTPLARAIKYHHTHIVDYLLRAGANVLQTEYVMLLPHLVKAKQGKLKAVLKRFIAAMCNDKRDRLFLRALSEGNLEIVHGLVEAGVNVNPDTRHCARVGHQKYPPSIFLECNREHSSPLAVAASNGHLEIVRYLVESGANVNCHRDSSTEKEWDRWCTRPQYSPLAAAAKSNRTEVVQFLTSIGATLLKGEGRIYNSGSSDLSRRRTSVGEFVESIAFSEEIDCPAVAAIQARQRKGMARRLLAKVANSCEKLLDAITMKDASASLIAFVDQVGNTKWNPLPTQAAQESPYAIAHKPPDPEDEELSILARITVLMAGAIFSAVLLYLCLSQHGFSTLRLPILTSNAGQSWASDPIITRNNFILAMYIGLTPIDFESWGSNDHLLPKPSLFSPPLPDSPPTERAREPMAAGKSSYEDDSPVIDLSNVVDTIMDGSPSVSSHLTTSSPFSMTTSAPDFTTTDTLMNGTICCGHCDSKF